MADEDVFPPERNLEAMKMEDEDVFPPERNLEGMAPAIPEQAVKIPGVENTEHPQ